MSKNTKNINGLSIGEDRYRFLVEQSGEMISTHRPGDWAYTAVNPAVTAISGYAPEEVMGKPAYDFFHPEDAQAMKNKLIPAIYQHGVRTFRYRHRHKSGNYYWTESTHRSIRDQASGELKEIISVSRDITLQVQAEMASRRLAEVVEVSSDLVVFCDREFRVTYMNASALQGLGANQARTGMHLRALLSLKDFQKIKTLACQLAHQTGEWVGNLRLTSPQFSRRYIVLQEVLVHPQRSYTETDDFYSLIIRDVSEQKQAELDARQHQADLAHAARLMTMGEMASGIAHEINQPLATTLNYARGAVRQIENGKIAAVEQLVPVLGNIARQAQRAADIVKRLRALVKKTPYQRRAFDANAACEDVVEFLKHELIERGIDVAFQLSDAEPILEADLIQIEQVLVNLLRNAIDAFDGSTRADKTIQLQTRVDGRNLAIDVTDNGAGVDHSLREQLFEPYVSSKAEGLGMGLSISRTIVEAHGGTINLDSDGRSYTCFRVSLPLQDKKA